jgi:arylsulfatase A-like enzyme
MRLAIRILVVATVIVSAGTSSATAEPSRPNILFLFADDQRADALGAFGHPVLKTPHLDSLVARGFVFPNAYCFGANVGAVCTPSRNMLLSGKAYFRYPGPLAPGDAPNFPLSMKDAGYFTYHHGKRGNTALNIQAKFDVNKYLQNDQAERNSGEPGKEIVDDAITFLKSRKADRPFCMYLAFGNPHDPRVAAQKYLDMYQRDRIPLPKNYLPVHPFDNGEMVVRDEQLAPWPRTEDEVRKQLHEYYAVITAMDHHIGRLLGTLKDLGQYDNTIIVFSADHGLAVGSHGLFGKQNLYEDGMRVPLVFAGPGIPKGRSEALVYLFDLYPTLCGFAGATAPAGIDGKSLKPIIEGKATGVRDAIFTAYRDVQRAVRNDRWKLIRYPQINRTQLFDLQADPHELHDLAADTAQAPRVTELLALLADLQKHYGDTTPLTSANPKSPVFTPPSPEELERLRAPRKKKGTNRQ